jgi:anaerobic selenocysteine-containing dehydrogenase
LARFIPAALRRLSPRQNELILMTLRSHDQFNTTGYSNDDRDRGVSGSRRVLFLNRLDMEARGVTAGDRLRVVSHYQSPSNHGSSDAETRTLEGLVAYPYDLPQGTAAAYFPEANPLIFLESMADRSRTPTSKSVRITIERLEPEAAR